MADFDKFLFSYITFLFFIVFIIAIGGGEFFAGNNLDTIGTPPQPLPPSDTGNPLIDWITGAWSALGYYTANIVYFFELLSVDTGLQFLTLLVISPATIIIIWNLLKIIRGTT